MFMHHLLDTNRPLWDTCATTPFLQKLACGTLPASHFLHYLREDALYLFAYAKLCGHAVTNAETLSDQRLFAALLHAVTGDELALRFAHLTACGLDEAAILHTQPRAVTQEYIDLLETASTSGDRAQMLAALLPCMLSYSHIFQLLAAQPESRRSRYRAFIDDYASPAFAHDCAHWISVATTLCDTLSSDEQSAFARTFNAASSLELRF